MRSSYGKSPKLSWVSSHLALAEAILALQRKVLSIEADLAQQTTSGSTSRCISIDWERIARAMEAARDAITSPSGQAFIALISPVLAGLGKLILRWLGG